MGTLWPDPPALPARCRRCHKSTARSRLVDGLGSECAKQLGLTIHTPRVRVLPQTGPDLLQTLNDERADLDEPDDHCDGWDR